MTDGEMTIPVCCSQDFKLIFNGEYDIPMSKPPKTVLDIGANVGMFTVWAARQWPEAEITSYEPWQENVELLCKNVEQYRNVTVIPMAVRGESGPGQMYENGGFSPCHSFTMGTGPTRQVHCDAADKIGSAEFVKIDTEGSEWEILQNLNLSATNYIALEAHTRADANRIGGFLAERGFALHNAYPAGAGCLLMKFIRRSVLPTEKKLFVAIPTYGATAPSPFWKCVMRLQEKPPCNMQLRILDGDSLVSRARNTLTAEFLNSDCSHMLFIDSDLIFSGDQIDRLMQHDADVVAGFYPKKQDGPLNWVCNGKAGEKPDENGLQEVRYMGTGFLRVARQVFLRMIERWGPEIEYHPDHAPSRTEYDLWPVGVYKYDNGFRRYLSEDWYFCQRWLDLGGKVYGDTRIVLKHIGTATFPLLSQREQISNPIEPGKN